MSEAAYLTSDFFSDLSLGKVPGSYPWEIIGTHPNITTATDPADCISLHNGTSYISSYTFSTTADINKIACTNNDADWTVEVAGLDANWEEVTQYVTLTGQTPKTLDTALIRVNRMRNVDPDVASSTVTLATSGATWNAGLPQSNTDYRSQINGDHNISLCTVYTVPAGKRALFYGGYAAIASSGVVSESAVLAWRIRIYGGQFMTGRTIALNGNGSSNWAYINKMPVPLPARTDALVRCNEVTGTMGLSAGFHVMVLPEED